MNIHLKERQKGKLSELKTKDTFKILENSFIFMKMDVEGLSCRPKKVAGAKEDPKLIKVRIPEGKVPVICLNTGKAQFLDLNEEVHIVELDAREILREKGVKHASEDNRPGVGLS